MYKNKLTLFIYIGIFILLLGQVYFSSGRATDGDRLTEIDAQLNDLNTENESLQTQLYQLTSIASIQKYAENNHMIPETVANLGSVTVASLVTKP
jgi:coenzyme F420-reducing hydrogenase delta subunit